jgi:hypothetical protein
MGGPGTLAEALSGHGVPTREFTKNEKILLGTWNTGNDQSCSLSRLHVLVAHYYREHGIVPDDAAGLMEMCETTEGRKWFSTMTAANQFDLLSPIINPVTGGLYGSLHSKSWSQWGMDITVVPREKWLEEANVDPNKFVLKYHNEVTEEEKARLRAKLGPNVQIGESKFASSDEPVTAVLRIKMYGEEPGSVLMDTHLAL